MIQTYLFLNYCDLLFSFFILKKELTKLILNSNGISISLEIFFAKSTFTYAHFNFNPGISTSS